MDIPRGNLDNERLQSVVFRAGSFGYVEVVNPDPSQGPTSYSIRTVRWSDED